MVIVLYFPFKINYQSLWPFWIQAFSAKIKGLLKWIQKILTRIFQEFKKQQEENKMAQKELELKKIKVEQEKGTFQAKYLDHF